MQILSMKAEYALLAMIYIALQEKSARDRRGNFITVEEISESTGIPLNFLSKIMIALNKGDLIRSSRGYKGGCALARPSDKITAYDIIEAVEGAMKLSRCASNPDACPATSSCPFFSMWIEAQDGLEGVLKKYTLHSLAICIKGLPEESNFFRSLRERFIDKRVKELA